MALNTKTALSATGLVGGVLIRVCRMCVCKFVTYIFRELGGYKGTTLVPPWHKETGGIVGVNKISYQCTKIHLQFTQTMLSNPSP